MTLSADGKVYVCTVMDPDGKQFDVHDHTVPTFEAIIAAMQIGEAMKARLYYKSKDTGATWAYCVEEM